MFELLTGIVIAGLVYMAYRGKQYDKQVAEERDEADRAADMCSRCEDYDCLVACQERRKMERGRR